MMVQEAQQKVGRTFETLFISCLLLSILLSSGVFFVYWQNASLQTQITELSQQIQDLSLELNMTVNQLQYYKTQAEYYSDLQNISNSQEGIKGEATTYLVAVKALREGFRLYYEGVTTEMEIELREGEGRILINTESKTGIDLQTSIRTATIVAEKITGLTLGKTDILLTVKSESEEEIVDGPSAGAAMTVAIIAAIQNQPLDNSVYLTGTVNPNGTIGQVGGILEKGVAVAEEGATKFLVPQGQGVVPVIEGRRWKEISLQEYLQELGFNTQVIEVNTVQIAYQTYVI